MKKVVSVLAFLAVLMLFAAPVLAEPVSVTVTPNEIKSDVDVNNEYSVTITNNGGQADSFKLVPNGPYIYWVTVPVWLVNLQGGETKTFNLMIFPTGDRYGRFYYTLSAVSINNPSVSGSANFYLDVEPVRISDVVAVNDGGRISVTMKADSLKRRDITFSLSLRKDGNVAAAGSVINDQIYGEKSLSGTIDVPSSMLAGDYELYIEATAEGTTIKSSQPFTLEPVHDVVKTRAEVDSFFYKEITITLSNKGNVVEDGYQIVENTDASQLTGFVTAPNGCTTAGSTKTCNYVVSSLAPGATAKVIYRIEFWPTLMQYFGASLAIVAILAFTFIHKTKPSITKKSVSRGDGTHGIILEIKNPFLHHMTNVVVRDFVHPLATVVHEEIESIKPVIRKTEQGTELVWKLGDIRPKETRMLKYGVKTVFQGGGVAAPKAYIRFMNPKGKSFRIFSNEL